MDIKIYVRHEAYKFLRYWVDNDDKEIAGYCEANYDQKSKFIIVSKAHIVKMLSNSGASVKLDNEDHHRLITELPDTAELRCHWHSHVNMGVTPSSTDDATNIENAEHGWFASLILNKKGDVSGQIAFPTKSEFGERVVYYNNIPVTVEPELTPEELDFAKTELVRVQPPKPVYSGPSNYTTPDDWKSRNGHGDYWANKEWNYVTGKWEDKKDKVIGIGHKGQGSLFEERPQDDSPLLTQLRELEEENEMRRLNKSEADLNDVPSVEDWGWLGLGLENEAKMLCMSVRKYRNIITNENHKKFQTTVNRLEALYDREFGSK